jgi:proline iminopeptidase
VRLFYQVVGTGPDTVVFVHGTPSTMYSLARDFSGLGDGFTLVFFDQRGGGRSQLVLSPDSLTWQLHVADLETIRAHLGLERMNVFAVSWGAWIASLYAAQHPDHVRRMVLLPARARSQPPQPTDPGPLLPPLDSVRQARADSLLKIWRTAQDPVVVCDQYWVLMRPAFFFDTTRASAMQGSFCNEPTDVLRHTWQVSDARMRSLGDFDLRPQLRQITAPTLIMKGSHTTLPHAWTTEWAQEMPNSRLMWVNNAGLLPWLERPEVVFPALATFYRGSWPSAARVMR